ncbi:MAG: DUF3347 domain-containing protein [Ferruginibacter sp.]
MKYTIIGLAISVLGFTACNSNVDNKSADKQDMSQHEMKDMNMHDSSSENPAIKASESININSIITYYLQMKNAFTKDNDKEAATAGNEMVKAFAAFNKTSLSADQAKIYNDIEDDAKEHAEHIGMNAGNIKHQREHFEMLSKDMADLIKTFGNGGQTLYKDFCPMYNGGKGGYWISETKEIRNPYLGKAMPTCGTVKQEMK